MKLSRRRFLTLSAAMACAPRLAHATTWQGRALGSDVSVTLEGPRDVVAETLAEIPNWLVGIEEEFSLYRPSTLKRLNAAGRLETGARFKSLLGMCRRAYQLSDGLFDPTVQPLWQALAQGKDPAPTRSLIGFDRLSWGDAQPVTLGPGQQLTFNGIAQGFATELVADQLAARGFDRALVDMGEAAALGGPFRLALVDPIHGRVGERSLTNTAIATSSPAALRIKTESHILGPQGQAPLWSTVSIEGPSATLADALSTAAVFMDLARLHRLKDEAGLKRITTVDAEGNLSTI